MPFHPSLIVTAPPSSGHTSRPFVTAALAPFVVLFLIACFAVPVQCKGYQFSYKETDLSWCVIAECNGPNQSLLNTLKKFHEQDKKFGGAVCGDGVCNGSGRETCLSCPRDCGQCRDGDTPPKGCKNPKHIALTFDDGPTEYTETVVKSLDEAKVKATFYVNAIRFANASRAQTATSLKALRTAFNSGHTIATHTFTHRGLVHGSTGNLTPSLGGLDFDSLLAEMHFNDIVIASVIGKAPRFFRPPYLEFNTTVSAHLEALGYYTQWVNVDTKDFTMGHLGHEIVARTFDSALQGAKAMYLGRMGFIHLQHDVIKASALAVSDIVKSAKRAGLEIVPMHECLGLDESQVYTDKYGIKPGSKQAGESGGSELSQSLNGALRLSAGGMISAAVWGLVLAFFAS
ncbi:hypothetical protein BCR44DRAFT_63895 [Catenaria anguillulae PL171]|uniref:NodB homology domain-containing protein n=1 Tax=Catenaria anguillulae PL171 TaxID=765915 RepID=A0A1Y2HL52_9FUNG|nr:hypothetical protein BCR44DRAFT_63895 [Catenaria anguillulae PL171]